MEYNEIACSAKQAKSSSIIHHVRLVLHAYTYASIVSLRNNSFGNTKYDLERHSRAGTDKPYQQSSRAY